MKRGLSDTPPPMVNFTITQLSMNNTNSSSPFLVNSTDTSAIIELIVTASVVEEEEEANNDSTTNVTEQKLLVVSCCEKKEDDTTPMIDLFLLPTEEDNGEDYEVIDVYVMPVPTTRRQQKEDAVDYEENDNIIHASTSPSSYDIYSPIPPPCLPTEITQLCSAVCDHPGTTALVLGLLAVLIVVEIVLAVYLGNLIKGAINRCYKKYKGGTELVINRGFCNSVV